MADFNMPGTSSYISFLTLNAISRLNITAFVPFPSVCRKISNCSEISTNPSTRFNVFINLFWYGNCTSLLADRVESKNMALKIENNSDGNKTTIRLIGRIDSEHFEELKVQMKGTGTNTVLDLCELTSQGLRNSFWLKGMQVGLKNVFDCIKAFSETDFTKDLKKFDVPTLILHGNDDQIVPIGVSAMLSSKLIEDAKLKVYNGGAHGMCSTQKDEVNADLLTFLKGQALRPCGGRRFEQSTPLSYHKTLPGDI